MSFSIGQNTIGRPLTSIEMALLAAAMAALLCRRRKTGAAVGFAGGYSVGEAWNAVSEALNAFWDIPNFAAKWAMEQFAAALKALEDWARSFGADFLADAFARARGLFEQLKEWAEQMFGRAGQMLLAAVLLYLVYSRFFLRR